MFGIILKGKLPLGLWELDFYFLGGRWDFFWFNLDTKLSIAVVLQRYDYWPFGFYIGNISCLFMTNLCVGYACVHVVLLY